MDCCLQLRINPKTRRQNSLNNFKEDWEDRGRKQWLRRLIPTIFMLYRTLLKLSHPDSARASLPQDTLRVSKRVRVRLAAYGLLSGHQAPMATRVDIRYSKNPATRRNIPLLTTTMALIPAGSLRGHFAGHPTPDSLYSDVAQHVTDTWVSFTASTKHFVRQSMGFEIVRCPLELHRKEVDVTPWYPLAIGDVPISATFGVHQAVYGVLQPANNCSTLVLPMLLDITIYYNYLKMLYSYWMQPLPLRHVYGTVCPLFGIWHPYKYCVDHTYSAFLFYLWWHLNTMGPFKTQMQDNYMHILPLSLRSVLFWQFTCPFPVFRHTCVLLLAAEPSKTLLAGLSRLVLQYAPALLRLGIMVCDCSWYHRTPGTDEAARRCLQVSLYRIQKLNPQHRDSGYKRALHLARRMWSPYHSSLLASAFVEEKGEALLSRLARAVGEDTSITSVADYHKTFVALRHQQPGTRKPLTSPHITRETIRAVSMHLARLLACIHASAVPFVKKMAAQPRPGARAANTMQATMDWLA